MQRKILNTKKICSRSYIQSRQEKLRSIPILNKIKHMKKSSVLYSIPCGCAFAFLLVGMMSLVPSSAVYADNCTDTEPPATDSMTISPITSSGSAAPAPTASLSLSNKNMASTAVVPGETATVSTNVTVNVSNASAYSLTLKVNNANMTANGTTIAAGNVVNDNTWGYKWDNASSYTAPSTTAKTLSVPALSNSSASFTKTLTFGAKFANSANAGHYKNEGTLSLVASPKAATYTLADLTQLQQLTLAPEACANTPHLSGQNYSAEYTLTDVRDGYTYKVRKLGDGKCWMTQNLKLHQFSTTNAWDYCTPGRKLNSTTSDVSADWTLPKSNTSGFSSNTASNTYVTNDTGYYTWCAATAGTAGGCKNSFTGTTDAPSNPITSGNAASSICPKGWKLPTGGTSGNTDFYNLFNNIGLTYQGGGLAVSGSTFWGDGDLDKIQGPVYNFTYNGYMSSSSGPQGPSQYGYWWSRTALTSTFAYVLYVTNNYIVPGSGNDGAREIGLAVRCVAQ